VIRGLFPIQRRKSVPQDYIDFAYVKEYASFERVIAWYNLKLFGTGTQRSVLCPFHRERKASCKIDLDRNIFHCFGCETKGNVLEFVARMEGDEDDLRGAAIKIAEVCEIALAPPRSPAPRRQPGRPARRRRAAEVWAEGAAAPQKPSSTSAARLANDNALAPDGTVPDGAINPPLTFALKLDPAHPYLAARGLSPATIAAFGLGHCARGVMAGRICIPIHDAAGQLVAYAGRWPGDDLPEGEERYRLPAKFHKSAVLFNLHRVPEGEHLVLVEGYWSAIRLHALRLPAAALMGWSASAEQLALLRDRGVRFLTLLLDGDDAGRRGRERVLPELAQSFFVRAPLLPDGQKPDTLPEPLLRQLVAFDAL